MKKRLFAWQMSENSSQSSFIPLVAFLLVLFRTFFVQRLLAFFFILVHQAAISFFLRMHHLFVRFYPCCWFFADEFMHVHIARVVVQPEKLLVTVLIHATLKVTLYYLDSLFGLLL